MKIAIAGPYSSPEPGTRLENLLKLNTAALSVFKLGHIPVIGVNAALPVVELMDSSDKYEAIMKISMGVIEDCDALYLIAESPGANREKEFLLSKGKPVYTSIHEIPKL